MCVPWDRLSFLVFVFSPSRLPPVVTQLPGKKDLFIEADLMSPLDRIANVSTLKVNPDVRPLG